MSRVPTVRRSDLDRALAALKAAGFDVARVELKPGGDITILTAEPIPPTDSAPVAGLDAWRSERRRGAGAT